ncbi:MAG: hypothetical protein N3A72_01685 [bacterium]|nr:hypothetical protein [bacterium]
MGIGFLVSMTIREEDEKLITEFSKDCKIEQPLSRTKRNVEYMLWEKKYLPRFMSPVRITFLTKENKEIEIDKKFMKSKSPELVKFIEFLKKIPRLKHLSINFGECLSMTIHEEDEKFIAVFSEGIKVERSLSRMKRNVIGILWEKQYFPRFMQPTPLIFLTKEGKKILIDKEFLKSNSPELIKFLEFLKRVLL